MSEFPHRYTPEVAGEILAAIEEGESLIQTCKRPDLPSMRSVFRWLEDDVDGFRQKYARAREVQGHVRAEMAIDAAREAKDAGLGRLAYDALRWHAGKLLPKVYGDKVTNENQTLGANGQPVDPAPFVVQFVKAKDGRPE